MPGVLSVTESAGMIMAAKRTTNVDGSRAGLALGARGRQLWSEVTAKGELTPTEVTILEEACRAADRLERLDEILRGKKSTWLELIPTSLDGSVVLVAIGNVLVEVRQQQTTLKGLLAELRQSRSARATPAKPPADATPAAADEGGAPRATATAGITDLAQWVADHTPTAG